MLRKIVIRIAVWNTILETTEGLKNKATLEEKMEAPLLFDYVTVKLQNYVLVFAGKSMMEDISSKEVRHFIWSYNLYTDQWRKYRIPASESTPDMVQGASAVAIGTDVFMFGGRCPALWPYFSWNHLWKLTINKNRYFRWTKIPEKANSEIPSHRSGHSAWEYKAKMWVFGGLGIPPFLGTGYLNEHGDFTKGYNNQLLCYDSCCNTWTNPECLGAVPSPRGKHATASVRDKVFLFGGYQSTSLGDFFVMNMNSLSWTMIKTNQPHPEPRKAMSLTAVTTNHLVLYGGCSISCLNSTWILDIENEVWKPYTQLKDWEHFHTGTRGLTKSVFIIGGVATFHLMLEPKSLQQLAMHTIHQHKHMLPWKHLPNKLVNNLMDPAEDEKPKS